MMRSPSETIQHKERARRFRQIAHPDDLTRLPSRTLLADRVCRAIAQAKRWGQTLAVVRLDLDGLDEICDIHGPDIGDLALASVAHHMKRTLRRGDTLARLDGNTFAAVLLDFDDAMAVVPALKRLLQAATEIVEVEDVSVHLSASMGVACYPQEEDADADELLRQASHALHGARAAGKNRYQFFDCAQDARAGVLPESIERIRQALAADEFVLYYQPKVNMSTGMVVGAEALIRWLHPERGLLMPAEFLPIVEDHPLAVELGDWVFETALTQAEKWLDAGIDVPVSVNVGARQLLHPSFVNQLAAALARHSRIHPSNLELEIQETSATDDMTRLSRLLAKCSELGVTAALEDFGAGHLSLLELRRLPAYHLKIDPGFVRDILENPDDLTILEGVLGLARAFHREPVAKGVETAEQGLMLLRLGCELAQGYGIAQPMQAGDFPAWVAAWRPDPRWIEALSVSVDDRPLLHAGVEHRAWVAAIEAFLKGEAKLEPRVSRHQCQFGAWLYAEGPDGRTSRAAFQPVIALHWRIHALAAGIVKFHTQGRNDEGLARLSELKDLVDKLADLLNAFGRKKLVEVEC
ncbi:MAG: EAL domain-containing protein [Terracidiphilus sp.]|jgi:diguanylate cyclase (GGDEF)-like protein